MPCAPPDPCTARPAAVRDAASTQRFGPFTLGCHVQGLGTAPVASGLPVGDLRNPNLVHLRLLRTGKCASQDQPGLPGLQELGEAEKAVRGSGRDACPSEGLEKGKVIGNGQRTQESVCEGARRPLTRRSEGLRGGPEWLEKRPQGSR